MPIAPMHCPVSHADVVRVTDFEGATLRIVCTDYDETTGACRLKAHAAAAGPLSRLLERTEEGTLASHGIRCDLA